jgi:guanidinoacetate N-methyltransferase
MEDWQAPVMKRMAELACASQGDVLEIGFGRGVGSDYIQACKPASHTVIECNDSVVDRFQTWAKQHGGADIRLSHGLWQDELPKLGQFDGLFFHTYPLNEDDFIQQVAKSSTFAEHFFEHAARHLKPGGVFVYLTMEGDSIGRAHQRALLQHFSSVSLSVLDGLDIPSDTRDAHWVNQMLMVAAVK